MNPNFVDDLKKILGLPEKDKRPAKQPDQPRILANTGRFVYNPQSNVPEPVEPDPVEPHNPPENWEMPPLCNLYAPNDTEKKQCICVYFQASDLPENYCNDEFIKYATESERDFWARNVAFDVRYSGIRYQVSVDEKATKAAGGALRYKMETLSEINDIEFISGAQIAHYSRDGYFLSSKGFHSYLDEKFRENAKSDYLTLSYDDWQAKWGLKKYVIGGSGNNVSSYVIANVLGFDNLLKEFANVKPFLDQKAAEYFSKVLSKLENFDFYKYKGTALIDMIPTQKTRDESLEQDFGELTNVAFTNSRWLIKTETQESYNNPTGEFYEGYFEIIPAMTDTGGQDTGKWLAKIGECVALLGTPQGFQAACQKDPRLPELIKGQVFNSVQLVTEQGEPIRLMRWSMGWAVKWREHTTIFDTISGKVKIVEILKG